jgi:hypothetical protein
LTSVAEITGYMIIANALYHPSNITDTVSTPATSMPNRFQPGRNSSPAYGTSYQDVRSFHPRTLHMDVPPAPVVILANTLLLVLTLLNLSIA